MPRKRPPLPGQFRRLIVEALEDRALLAGLTGTYFDNPDFSSPRLTRVDAVVDFDWGTSPPDGTLAADAFSIRWTGQIEPAWSENYTFWVTANDGARLWVDDRLVLTHWTDASGAVALSGQTPLQAGNRHDITLEYYDATGEASVRLEWSSPGQARQVIPAERLFATESPDDRGSIQQEIWTDVPGASVGTLTAEAAYPDHPDARDYLLSFVSRQPNWADDYGQRIRGYLVPPSSEEYVLAVSGDEQVQLWLSSDADPAHKSCVAWSDLPTAPLDFAAFPTQQSAPLALVAGQRYYVELLHKESTGDDHFAVAWRSSSGEVLEVISGNVLLPYGTDLPLPAQGSFLATLSDSHPRIFATPERFAWLAGQIAGGGQQQSWFAGLQASADGYLDDPLPVYAKDERGTILSVSRNVMNHVYKLALAYRMTAESAYAERAWQELSTAADTQRFPDWNHGGHYLDTAEMTHAFAIGYDWLYDYWTPQQRTVLAEAIVRNGLNTALPLYRANSWWTVSTSNNWNLVCNGGIVLGALAVADQYPAVAEEILAEALPSAEAVMRHFTADNGGWYEGPGYWNYSIDYNARMLAGLETALGSDFGLGRTPGLAATAAFALYDSGPANLSFNYADAGAGKMRNPMLFWFARRYNLPSVSWHERIHGAGHALDLLWYDTRGGDAQSRAMPPDAHFRGSDQSAYRTQDVVTLRTRWNDPEASFAGFKAGQVGASHGHLDAGSFVLDALGQRWVHDLGGDSYALPGYFGSARWNYYRLRAEGHNTLVIDPGAGADQSIGALTQTFHFQSTADRAQAIVDLTPAYPGSARVWRGIELDRTDGSLLVEDEIERPAPATVWWFVHLKLDPGQVAISADGTSAMLTSGNDRLWARILPGSGAQFTLMDAAPLPTSPNPSGQNANAGFTKLAIKLENVTSRRLSVQFVPLAAGQSTPVKLPEAVPLAEWLVPGDHRVWLGDLDQYRAGDAADAVYVDPAWHAAVDAASTAEMAGFDTVAGNQVVPFTFAFQVPPGQQVSSARLTLGLKASADASADRLYLDDMAAACSFSTLGWTLAADATGRTLDLGPSLGKLQDGLLNLAVEGNTGVDWAVLDLQFSSQAASELLRTHNIPWGAMYTPNEALTEAGMSGHVRYYRGTTAAGRLATELPLFRASGVQVVLTLGSVNPNDYLDANDNIDLAKVRLELDPFFAMAGTIRPYIDDGTVWGIRFMDEPHDPTGRPPEFDIDPQQLGEVYDLIRQELGPVRVGSTSPAPYMITVPGADFAFGQYTHSKPAYGLTAVEYITQDSTLAHAYGLDYIASLNACTNTIDNETFFADYLALVQVPSVDFMTSWQWQQGSYPEPCFETRLHDSDPAVQSLIAEIALHTASLGAVADASVRDGASADQNFAAGDLAVKNDAGGENREAYLRFDLSGISRTITSAWLRLTAGQVDGPAENQLAFVADDAWSEAAITWNTRPAAHSPFASWTPVAGRAELFHVTALAEQARAGDGKLSLRISSTTPGAAMGTWFSSREEADANLRPQLLVMTSSPAGEPLLSAAGGSGDDRIRVVGEAGYLNVFVNNDGPLPDLRRAMASLDQVVVAGLGGNDRLTVDFSHGSPVPAGGLLLDGGDGDDVMELVAGGDALADAGGFSVGGVPIGVAGLELGAFHVGALTVSACTVRLGEDDALGPLTDVIVTGGGILDLAACTSAAGLVTLDDGTITGGSLVAAAYTVNNGAIDASLGGRGSLTKNTTGKVVLSGTNSYTGPTTVNDGILNIRNGQALGLGPALVAIKASGTHGRYGTLELEGPDFDLDKNLDTTGAGYGSHGVLRNINGLHTIFGNVTLTGGGGGSTYQSDAGTLAIVGNITTNYADRSLVLQGAGNGVLEGSIEDGVTVGLRVSKRGTGTWTLGGSASNTYTGTTSVQQGVLLLAKTDAVAVPGRLNVGDGSGNDSIVRLAGSGADQIADTAAVYVFKGETLDLNGRDEAVDVLLRGTTGSSSAAPVVTNNAAGTTATLTVGAAGGSGGFAGAIQDGAGQVALVKAGSGSYTVANDYSYTGLTRVEEGSFVLDFRLAGPLEVGPAGSLRGDGGTAAGLALAPGGLLTLEIGAEGADRLAARGAVTLAGRLAIAWTDGLAPAIGSRFDLLEGASIDVKPDFVFDTSLAPLAEGYWDYDVADGQVLHAVVNPRNLDADGNGLADPFSDGILILRYLFDPGGPWSVSDALGDAATRTARENIRRYLDAGLAAYLDADGNGVADPLSDGILILRYLLQPTASWPTGDAVGPGATRTSWEAIRAYLDQFQPELPSPDGEHIRYLIAAHLARGQAEEETPCAVLPAARGSA